MSIQKSEIKLDVGGKPVNAYLASPVNGGPGVLVLHAWWGLKPFFKLFCDRLAEQGFTVLAPDLRDGQIAKTIEEAKELMAKSDGQFIGQTVFTAKDHLREMTKDRIGLVGFSMGAAWALIVSSTVPDQVAATVLFYGNEDVDVTKITAKVMGHFSDNDEWEPLFHDRFLSSSCMVRGMRRPSSSPAAMTLMVKSWVEKDVSELVALTVMVWLAAAS